MFYDRAGFNSWGQLTQIAYQLPTDSCVAVHNYTGCDLISTSSDSRPVPVLSPLAFTPQRQLFTSHVSVPAFGQTETVLTLRLPPGVREYYQQRGLVNAMPIIEVDVAPGFSPKKCGYPYSDPFYCAKLLKGKGSEKLKALEGKGVVYTFPGKLASSVARGLQLNPMQEFHALDANDKIAFRNAAAQFGFKIARGYHVEDLKDLPKIKTTLQTDNVWVKLAHGSGGDTVVRVKISEFENAIFSIRERFRSMTREAFTQSIFAENGFLKNWPQDSFAPHNSAFIVEEDLSAYGRVRSGGPFSSSVLISKDGTSKVLGVYKQNVLNGKFMGSCIYQPDPHELELITEQTERIGDYCRTIGFYGLAGIDFFIIENQSGEIEIFNIEMNARPSSSANAHSLAGKLGSEHWINLTFETKNDITTMNELRQALGPDLSKHLTHDSSAGALIPICLYSQWLRQAHGRSDCMLTPALSLRKVRFLLAGDDPETLEVLQKKLISKGFH